MSYLHSSQDDIGMQDMPARPDKQVVSGLPKVSLPLGSHNVPTSFSSLPPKANRVVGTRGRCICARAASDQRLPSVAPEGGQDGPCLLPSSTVRPNGVITMNSTRNWNLEWILCQGSNFYAAHRVSVHSPNLLETIERFESKGVPLVVENLQSHEKWSQHIFTLDQFCEGTSTTIDVRNVHNGKDSTLPLKDFIAKCRTSPIHTNEEETERFYGKDAECPKSWDKCLRNGVIPEAILSKGKGDYLRYLPDEPDSIIETLMCYFGIGDTCTPCHKDLCASSGQNVMCYTERDGSAFWFMTESSSAPAVAEYFRSELGQELDHENYVVSIEQLSNAPFKVFVVQQKLGDMVLVPPRSCHQVVNAGGITVKTSWSRMTLKGLSVAYHFELPIYRRVCRPETYRVKSTIFYSLTSLVNQLEKVNATLGSSDGTWRNIMLEYSFNDRLTTGLVRQAQDLTSLYDCLLLDEYEPDPDIRSRIASAPYNAGYRITCDFCSADIFQSYFECRECSTECHLCPGCYAEGRNCRCGQIQPMQSRDFADLTELRTRAVRSINTYETIQGRTYTPPLDLEGSPTAARLTFRAACLLYKTRSGGGQKRFAAVCGRGEHTHEVPRSWAIFCKKCHLSKCFQHLLADHNMHSAEALALSADKTHDIYHAYHQRSKNRFFEQLPRLREDHERGDHPQAFHYHQLTINAMEYRHCRPNNPVQLQLGWYDTPLVDQDEDIVDNISLHEVDKSSSFEPPEVYMDYCSATSDSQVKSLFQFKPRQPISKMPKRRMYVDIPLSPYRTRCITRSLTNSVGTTEARLAISTIANPSSSSSKDVYSSNTQKRLTKMSPPELLSFPVPLASSPSEQFNGPTQSKSVDRRAHINVLMKADVAKRGIKPKTSISDPFLLFMSSEGEGVSLSFDKRNELSGRHHSPVDMVEPSTVASEIPSPEYCRSSKVSVKHRMYVKVPQAPYNIKLKTASSDTRAVRTPRAFSSSTDEKSTTAENKYVPPSKRASVHKSPLSGLRFNKIRPSQQVAGPIKFSTSLSPAVTSKRETTVTSDAPQQPAPLSTFGVQTSENLRKNGRSLLPENALPARKIILTEPMNVQKTRGASVSGSDLSGRSHQSERLSVVPFLANRGLPDPSNYPWRDSKHWVPSYQRNSFVRRSKGGLSERVGLHGLLLNSPPQRRYHPYHNMQLQKIHSKRGEQPFNPVPLGRQYVEFSVHTSCTSSPSSTSSSSSSVSSESRWSCTPNPDSTSIPSTPTDAPFSPATIRSNSPFLESILVKSAPREQYLLPKIIISTPQIIGSSQEDEDIDEQWEDTYEIRDEPAPQFIVFRTP